MRLLRRIVYWVRIARHEAELAEEMEFHRAQLESAGVPKDASRRRLGNATRMREESRAIWLAPWLESVLQDLRYAGRNLRRQPAFALAALIALGLAIGLNTSLFTVFNAVALRPWPVKNPGQVVRVFDVRREGGVSGYSLAEYRFLRENARSFSGFVITRSEGVRLGEEQPADPPMCHFVNGDYFEVLGVDMALGRGFRAEEDNVDSPEAVAVLSYASWQSRFGGDTEIIGKHIRVDGLPFRVVGVASAEFTGTSPGRHDLWVPWPATRLLRPRDPWTTALLKDAGSCCSELAGRMREGVRAEQARAELALLHERFLTERKEKARDVTLTPTPFLSHPGAKRKVVGTLALVFVGVTMILLLACANVGNLLLARASARGREISLRLWLGASRRRLVRQLLTESFVLACLAGAVGVTIAWVLPGIVVARAFPSEALSIRLAPDRMVLAYTLGLCTLACVAFGLAPALHATRKDSGRERLRLRHVLLGVQVALSVVLLTGAALVLRGVRYSQQKDPGFSIADISVVSIELPAEDHDPRYLKSFGANLEALLRGTAALQPSGLAGIPPLRSGKTYTSYQLPDEAEGKHRMAMFNDVTAGYFQALRIPMVRGRSFTAADEGSAVAVINETMARRHWAEENPVRKRVVINETVREIVGVARDAYTAGLNEIEPTAYVPFSGRVVPSIIVRRGTADAGAMLGDLVKSLESRAKVQVRPLSESLDRWLEPARMGAAIAGGMGLLALVLAAIGVGGVFGYAVEQRSREIGIRMAVGASARDVVAVICAGQVRALLLGLAAGFLAAVGGTRLLERSLFGLSTLDPVSYVLVAGVLAGAGLLATFFPARRATRIDPVAVLRQD